MPNPLETLDELVNDPDFARILQALSEQRAAFVDSRLLYPHINAAANAMARLKDAMTGLLPRAAIESADPSPVTVMAQQQLAEMSAAETGDDAAKAPQGE